MRGNERTPVDRRRLWIAIVGLVLCGVTGGSSRVDIPALLVMRPALIMMGATMLAMTAAWDVRRFRKPALLSLLFALTMAIQLVPLPPSIWLALPGHAAFAREAIALGEAQPWRPVALAPDLTWNSLFALVPVAFLLVAHAGIPSTQWRWLLVTTVALALGSALLGLAQIVAGPASSAYLYAATSRDLPVGFLANRNHQAVFLAASLPMIAACISLYAQACPRRRLPALGLGTTVALFLFIMIFVTGSRAGTMLAVFGTLGYFLLLPARPTGGKWSGKATYWGAATAATAMIAGLVILLGRATSINRALEEQGLSDLRVETLPVVLHITRDFFPFGIGWGAFDPVFRLYEPDSLLRPTFFNHAHDDLLEVLLAGGLPGLAVVLAFLAWWAVNAISAWRLPAGTESILARAGSLTSAILLAASLVDYPLRTPLLAMVLILACCWMTRAPVPHARSGKIVFDPLLP